MGMDGPTGSLRHNHGARPHAEPQHCVPHATETPRGVDFISTLFSLVYPTDGGVAEVLGPPVGVMCRV
jgi:hypothetical protein